MNNKHNDLTFKKFGYLVAIKYLGRIPSKAKRPIYKWLCICICGKEKAIETSDLKKGSIKSCGCKRKLLQREAKYIKDGLAAFNSLYGNYKRICARDRKLEFSLSREEFKLLTSQNCYYCNKEPSQIKKSKISFYKYNGIDRVDNSKGYTKNNSVSCCGECNKSKHNVSKNIILKAARFLNENS